MQLEQIRVLLLDDEPEALEHSRRLIADFVPESHIFCCKDAVEAVRLLNVQPVELIFLDLEIPDTNGFSLAVYAHEHQPKARLVFLTGHVELGAESFDYEPLDFLVKPVDLMRLERTFERFEALERTSVPSGIRVAVETTAGFVLVSPEEISYITREKRRTLIVCRETRYVTKYTLEEMEDLFREHHIFRVHQGYLIFLEQIARVTKSEFGTTYLAQLSSGQTVPVSRSQYPKLCSRLAELGVRFL